jgi:hypothetical protein
VTTPDASSFEAEAKAVLNVNQCAIPAKGLTTPCAVD